MPPKGGREKTWEATEAFGVTHAASVLAKFCEKPSFVIYSEDVCNGSMDCATLKTNIEMLTAMRKIMQNLSFKADDVESILEELAQMKKWEVDASWKVSMALRLRTMFRHFMQLAGRSTPPKWMNIDKAEKKPEEEKTPKDEKSMEKEQEDEDAPEVTICFCHEKGPQGMAKLTRKWKSGRTETEFSTNIVVPENKSETDPVTCVFKDGSHIVGDLMIMDWQEILKSKPGSIIQNIGWCGEHKEGKVVLKKCLDKRNGTVNFEFWALTLNNRQILMAVTEWFTNTDDCFAFMKGIASDFVDGIIMLQHLKDVRKGRMVSDAWIGKVDKKRAVNIIGKEFAKADKDFDFNIIIISYRLFSNL